VVVFRRSGRCAAVHGAALGSAAAADRAMGPKPGLSADRDRRRGHRTSPTPTAWPHCPCARSGSGWGRNRDGALHLRAKARPKLVDLMYDRVLAELPADYDSGLGWRPAVTALADRRSGRFHLRHPWLLQSHPRGRCSGRGSSSVQETVLRVLLAHRPAGGKGAVVFSGAVQHRCAAPCNPRPSLVGFERDGAFGGTVVVRAFRSCWKGASPPDLGDRFPLVARLARRRVVARRVRLYLDERPRLAFEAGLEPRHQREPVTEVRREAPSAASERRVPPLFSESPSRSEA